jgi:hypothetical protein
VIHVTTFHSSGDVNEEANKLTYLQLLALTRRLLVAIVPVSIADSILHRKLKSALSRSLLDLSVITLFPTLHADILQYVKVLHHRVCSILILLPVNDKMARNLLIIGATVSGSGKNVELIGLFLNRPVIIIIFTKMSKLAETVTLQTSIQELSGLNLGWDINCSD